MKQKLLYIPILFCVFFLKAQNTLTFTSTCSKVDTVTNFYLEDAKKLNFRYIYRSNNTYKDSIALNPVITSNFERALLAIYNATSMPARDTVVRLLNIHCFNPYLHDFLIQADSNLQWMKNLRANIIPTGYNTIDSLMSKFYLRKIFYATYYSPYGNVILRSDTALNTLALELFVKTLPGVFTASYDWHAGEQPDIEDTLNSSFHWLRYTYGWGDCESLCRFHRYWQFRVHNDCTVEYGGSYGHDLAVGLKEEELLFKATKVYPNPTSDLLTVDDLPLNSQLMLVTVLGEPVYSTTLVKKKVAIDVAEYPPGIYFLKIRSGSSGKTIKIIIID